MEKDFTKVYSRSSFESLYFYVSSLKVSVSDLRKKNKGKVTPRDLEIEVSVSDLRNKFDGRWFSDQPGLRNKFDGRWVLRKCEGFLRRENLLTEQKCLK